MRVQVPSSAFALIHFISASEVRFSLVADGAVRFCQTMSNAYTVRSTARGLRECSSAVSADCTRGS